MPLKKGSSKRVISQNIRTLRHEGRGSTVVSHRVAVGAQNTQVIPGVALFAAVQMMDDKDPNAFSEAAILASRAALLQKFPAISERGRLSTAACKAPTDARTELPLRNPRGGVTECRLTPFAYELGRPSIMETSVIALPTAKLQRFAPLGANETSPACSANPGDSSVCTLTILPKTGTRAALEIRPAALGHMNQGPTLDAGHHLKGDALNAPA